VNEEVLTVDEAAKFLKVSKAWLYQKKAAGLIPYHQNGGLVRFFKSELLEWLKAAN